MFKCYDSIKLPNNILKCDQCKEPFNAYDQPRFLPCGETICSTCVVKIEKEATNSKFKCGICMKDHFIPEEGFPINKKISDLITADPIEISRGKEYEKLQKSLNELQSIIQLLCYGCEDGTDLIAEYCNEQIRLIQLSTENKIEQMNKLSDELIAFVREYERTCIELYSNKNKTVKEYLNKTINEANTFLNEKQVYLQQLKTDDDEIKVFNSTCEKLQTDLSRKVVKLKSLIFNNRLIKFISNTKDINKHELGYFDYEQLKERSKVFSGSSDKTIKLWELKSGECFKTFIGHNTSVTCIKNVLDNILISGDAEGLLKIWKIETGECLKTIDAHTSIIYKILLVLNDKFVTSSADKTIKMFDTNTNECIRTFIGHEGEVRGIDKISDYKIASSSDDKTIRIWDLNSGECLQILKGHSYDIPSIAVISDDKIISGSFKETKIWDIESGQCLQTLNNGHSHYIKSIIHLSNEIMACCYEDGKIIIWNIENGECLKKFEAHSDCIWSLVKISNSKIISCSNKRIKVWNVKTGICLKTIEAHDEAVLCLDLSN